MLKFLEDLYNYINKYNIDFYSLSYLDQKKVIRKCLKIICHNNSKIKI